MNEVTIAAIKEKIKHIIANDLDVNISIDEIPDDASLYDGGLGLDSIAIVNFIVIIEKKFNISFDENEINAKLFNSITDLAGVVHTKVSEKIDTPLA